MQDMLPRPGTVASAMARKSSRRGSMSCIQFTVCSDLDPKARHGRTSAVDMGVAGGMCGDLIVHGYIGMAFGGVEWWLVSLASDVSLRSAAFLVCLPPSRRR